MLQNETKPDPLCIFPTILGPVNGVILTPDIAKIFHPTPEIKGQKHSTPETQCKSVESAFMLVTCLTLNTSLVCSGAIWLCCGLSRYWEKSARGVCFCLILQHTYKVTLWADWPWVIDCVSEHKPFHYGHTDKIQGLVMVFLCSQIFILSVCICLCLCNQWSYANNHTDAVDWLLILCAKSLDHTL